MGYGLSMEYFKARGFRTDYAKPKYHQICKKFTCSKNLLLTFSDRYQEYLSERKICCKINREKSVMLSRKCRQGNMTEPMYTAYIMMLIGLMILANSKDL